MNLRPYYVTGALGAVFVIAFVLFWATGYDKVNYATGEKTSHYNWPAIVIFAILGFGTLSLTGWLKREEIGWPESWQRALSSARVAPGRAPGTEARSGRIMFAGPVSAQDLHQALLDALEADPEAGEQPRVYLVASREGAIEIAFGVAGQEPLWTVSVTITAAGPQSSTATMTVGQTRPLGPSPDRDGIAGGEVVDAMFRHVTATVPQRLPAVAANRARHL